MIVVVIDDVDVDVVVDVADAVVGVCCVVCYVWFVDLYVLCM